MLLVYDGKSRKESFLYALDNFLAIKKEGTNKHMRGSEGAGKPKRRFGREKPEKGNLSQRFPFSDDCRDR
jgi:hypothetical protein